MKFRWVHIVNSNRKSPAYGFTLLCCLMINIFGARSKFWRNKIWKRLCWPNFIFWKMYTFTNRRNSQDFKIERATRFLRRKKYLWTSKKKEKKNLVYLTSCLVQNNFFLIIWLWNHWKEVRWFINFSFKYVKQSIGGTLWKSCIHSFWGFFFVVVVFCFSKQWLLCVLCF